VARRATGDRRPVTAALLVLSVAATACASSPTLAPPWSAPSPKVATIEIPEDAEARNRLRWIRLSREGRDALRAGRPQEAEIAFTAALSTFEATPAGDARIHATLGNLTRLASIYRRMDRSADADRVMAIVDGFVATEDHPGRSSDDYAARFEAWSAHPLEPAYLGPDPYASDARRFEPGLEALIRRTARRYRVDPHLVKAVVAAESNFDALAVSEKGAQGLMQLMPATAKQMGVQSPFRPSENIQGGVRYLKTLLDRYDDVDLALAAYNAGPVAVDRFGGIPPYPETETYVKRVLRFYREYREGGSP